MIYINDCGHDICIDPNNFMKFKVKMYKKIRDHCDMLEDYFDMRFYDINIVSPYEIIVEYKHIPYQGIEKKYFDFNGLEKELSLRGFDDCSNNSAFLF